MSKLTDFTFYYNTPFTDFSNTILFDSNSERDTYFNSAFDSLQFNDLRFNFIRDRGTIRISTPYHKIAGINYCKFISDFEPNQPYYAYVMDYQYINDQTTEITILIDGIMTFCQGDTLEKFDNLSVTRKHLPYYEYIVRIDELKNNDDVIKTHTKKYTDTKELLFKDLTMLIQVSCSLTADFGKIDDPKIQTSEGITFDNITAPVNLYVVKAVHFNKLMDKLSPFSWITQNIRSVSLIPSILLEGKSEKVNPKSYTFNELYKLKDNETTYRNSFDKQLEDISSNLDDLYKIFDLDSVEDMHLLRNEYTTSEVYTFNGDQLLIDNGQLSDKGLQFKSSYVMGYHNEVAIYVEDYKSMNILEKGSFLNDALFIKDFDDVPIMVDNYNLSMAKSSNQRQLAESKLVSNRISNIADSGADPKDRFMDGASLVTDLSPMNFFGKFKDEHEFYKQQQAEQKDMALDTNTITNQSNNNSLGIAERFFGITVKHAQPHFKEWEKVKKYYKLFGYLVNDENAKVNPKSMTVCDYVQFSGQFMINGIDIALNEMMKAQFENGVRFWHYNNQSNPMKQDPLNNKMRR